VIAVGSGGGRERFLSHAIRRITPRQELGAMGDAGAPRLRRQGALAETSARAAITGSASKHEHEGLGLPPPAHKRCMRWCCCASSSTIWRRERRAPATSPPRTRGAAGDRRSAAPRAAAGSEPAWTSTRSSLPIPTVCPPHLRAAGHRPQPAGTKPPPGAPLRGYPPPWPPGRFSRWPRPPRARTLSLPLFPACRGTSSRRLI